VMDVLPLASDTFSLVACLLYSLPPPCQPLLDPLFFFPSFYPFHSPFFFLSPFILPSSPPPFSLLLCFVY
jgi:hypothetical protein